jgi:hypothetical protein
MVGGFLISSSCPALGTHVLLDVAASKKDVDGRDKPGHDGFLDYIRIASLRSQ